jgi:photosystem II stability/assembly factor-like uncharacterized protein
MKNLKPIIITFPLVIFILLSGCKNNKETTAPEPVTGLQEVSWVHSGGPMAEGQYLWINTLAINSSGHVFAGVNDSAVYRSTDNGANWIHTSAGIELEYIKNVSIYSLVLNNNSHIFAGYLNVFRSTNNGDDWINIGADIEPFPLILLVNLQQAIIAASQSLGFGIMRSVDNGDNWTHHAAGLENTEIRSLAINSSNGELFVGTTNGVFRSSDNGDSWTQIGLTDNTIGAIAINTDGTLFAGDQYGEGIFKSDDNGINWTKSLDGLSMTVLFINSKGYIFAGTTDGASFSIDNGKTWKDCDDGFQGHVTAITAIAINSDGYLFAGTRFGGIYRSQESTTAK